MVEIIVEKARKGQGIFPITIDGEYVGEVSKEYFTGISDYYYDISLSDIPHGLEDDTMYGLLFPEGTPSKISEIRETLPGRLPMVREYIVAALKEKIVQWKKNVENAINMILVWEKLNPDPGSIDHDLLGYFKEFAREEAEF